VTGLLLAALGVMLLRLDWFKGLEALAFGIGLVGLAEILLRLDRLRADLRDFRGLPKPAAPQGAAGSPDKQPRSE
jgi:hypothetical protein